jgi:Glycosyltransferase
MRILLTSNASHEPPRGGSTRSNLLWLQSLVSRGHECQVVCPAWNATTDSTVEVNGIVIHRYAELAKHPAVLAERIRAFSPDWVLVSSEDLSHSLLWQAASAASGRIVYIAHTPQFLPFGPESWNPDPKATRIVRDARAVVAIGRHMAGYIEQHAGRPAVVIHPPTYGTPPYPSYSNFGRGFVSMINPCAVKGIAIFAELAKRFPDVPFAALKGWGTTSEDRALLETLPNVRLLDPIKNIDELLSQTTVLLMPSLWYEGFGLITMEAMLRGVPVIASDSGGLMEAKEGTGFVIPVRPIREYHRAFDENHMPMPVVEEQDIAPWADALRTLLTDRACYEAESARSREAGLRFVQGLRAEAFEEMLASLTPAPVQRPMDLEERLRQLSPEKRALFLQRLRKK